LELVEQGSGVLVVGCGGCRAFDDVAVDRDIIGVADEDLGVGQLVTPDGQAFWIDDPDQAMTPPVG
jgi:hypothetical protein